MSELVRETRAHLRGVFWLPCPLCGRMFGGHEAAAVGWGIPDQPSQPTMGSRLVCWRCEGDQRADLRITDWMYFGFRPFDWEPPEELEAERW